MKWCLDLLRLSVVFRFVYSTWWQRAWMAFCVISVGVSCAAVWQCGFTATPEAPISIKILTPVSTVFSIASLCVTFFGFLWSNRTHKMILPNCGFLKIWQDRIKNILDLVHISQTQTDAGYAKISIGTDGDFSVESIEIDKYLKNGGSISFQIFPRRRSNLWRRINKHLAECVLKLSMKQAACGHKGFFNEGKVAMISPLAMRVNDDLQNKDSAEKSLCISVVKTDYYTSYLTNEAYRDPVVQVFQMMRLPQLHSVRRIIWDAVFMPSRSKSRDSRQAAPLPPTGRVHAETALRKTCPSCPLKGSCAARTCEASRRIRP